MSLLSYHRRLQRFRLTTFLELRMRGDLIEDFKIINCFVNYGHNMYGTNTAYRTRNLDVTSHHPLRSEHDFFNKELSNIGTSCHYACEIPQVSDLFNLSKPDSLNGFWKLSEEIFNGISNKSEHVNSLLVCYTAVFRVVTQRSSPLVGRSVA